MLTELQFELWIGDAAAVRTKRTLAHYDEELGPIFHRDVFFRPNAELGVRSIRVTIGCVNTLDPDTGAVLTTSDPFTQEDVGGLEVRPTDGVIFTSGGDEASIWTLSPTDTQTLIGLTGIGGVGDLTFTPLPTIKDQCKNGGWQRFSFPYSFKNQGDCIQLVNTGK